MAFRIRPFFIVVYGIHFNRISCTKITHKANAKNMNMMIKISQLNPKKRDVTAC